MRRMTTDGTAHQPARLLRQQSDGAAQPPARTIVWPAVGQDPSLTPLAIPTSDAQTNSLADPGTSPLPASQDVQRQFESARKQGRAEGEALGAQRASQRLDPVLADLGVLLKELAQLRPRLRVELEEDTVKLALAIARRVLHRELATDPEAILGLVMAAFHKANSRDIHRLRICPQSAAVLEEHRARLNLPEEIKITRDPSLARGSVILETSRGELDASMDTQLGEIERGLTDIMRRRTT
jgi:flagellar assembly protein FliH